MIIFYNIVLKKNRKRTNDIVQVNAMKTQLYSKKFTKAIAMSGENLRTNTLIPISKLQSNNAVAYQGHVAPRAN